MVKGIHRTKNGWANEDSVLVEYDNGDRIDMPASEYQANDYAPSIEASPWYEGYSNA